MAPPLASRRIVITRAAAQAGELAAALAALGADIVPLPTIAIAPPQEFAPLDRALRDIGGYHGHVFTSANAVRACFVRARELGLDLTPAAGAWICAVGPATAAALGEEGWRAGIVPAAAGAEGVVAALADVAVAGQRVFFPRAAAGRELIPEALARRGARLDLVAAYRTLLPEESAARARALFPSGGPPAADAVVFASPSSARHLAALLGGDYRARLRGVVLVAIGPATRAELVALDLPVAAEARDAGAAALAAALVEHWNAGTA